NYLLSDNTYWRIFGGYLLTWEETAYVATQVIEITVSAVDYNEVCDRRVVPFATGVTTVKAVVEQLHSQILAEEGVTLEAVVDPGLVWPATDFQSAPLRDVLNALADFSNYNWKIDFFKTLRFSAQP